MNTDLANWLILLGIVSPVLMLAFTRLSKMTLTGFGCFIPYSPALVIVNWDFKIYL